jgi:hypothetical protein
MLEVWEEYNIRMATANQAIMFLSGVAGQV